MPCRNIFSDYVLEGFQRFLKNLPGLESEGRSVRKLKKIAPSEILVFRRSHSTKQRLIQIELDTTVKRSCSSLLTSVVRKHHVLCTPNSRSDCFGLPIPRPSGSRRGRPPKAFEDMIPSSYPGKRPDSNLDKNHRETHMFDTTNVETRIS